MKYAGNNFSKDEHEISQYLSGLLKKVLVNHDIDGLSQIVLHELGHDNGFKLKRATYLVDNPDFDHLIGVAGYDKCECKFHRDDLWQNPICFKCDMKNAEYHNKIQNFLSESLKKKDINLSDQKDLMMLGNNLDIEKPEFLSWNMKHGNHGLLIFEKNDKDSMSDWKRIFFANIAALLSFCAF